MPITTLYLSDEAMHGLYMQARSLAFTSRPNNPNTTMRPKGITLYVEALATAQHTLAPNIIHIESTLQRQAHSFTFKHSSTLLTLASAYLSLPNITHRTLHTNAQRASLLIEAIGLGHVIAQGVAPSPPRIAPTYSVARRR